jgi:hypothetical protein
LGIHREGAKSAKRNIGHGFYFVENPPLYKATALQELRLCKATARQARITRMGEMLETSRDAVGPDMRGIMPNMDVL